MNLGEIVKEYRLEHGLSQREFSKICGLSNAYISMLESNRNTKTGLPVAPSLEAIKAVSDAMHVPLDETLARLGNIRVSLVPLDASTPSSTLTEDEQRLLMAYRNASDDLRLAAIAMLESFQCAGKKSPAESTGT